MSYEISLLQAGDSTPEELATATQVQGEYMPITRGEKRSIEVVKVTDEMKESGAYRKLRLERMNKRHQGMRQKKAAEAEKEDKK
jgi:large subunit ribosomal protein L13e